MQSVVYTDTIGRQASAYGRLLGGRNLKKKRILLTYFHAEVYIQSTHS